MINDPVFAQELPDLVNEIEKNLAESEITIPQRPRSAMFRPATSSSHQSGQ